MAKETPTPTVPTVQSGPKGVTLPFYDETGKLTPLVVEAMENGATSGHHPEDPDKIVLTFATAEQADAFEAAIK